MKTKREGAYMQTISGRGFWPMDPRLEEVDINDIAHALSNVCRFGGHMAEFYSVAQHSVIVSDLLPRNLALQGLLHDAPEAYIGDMIQPLKYCMPQFKDIENRVWAVIATRYGLPENMDDQVHVADKRAIVTEARDLLHIHVDWLDREPYCSFAPVCMKIDPLPPGQAKALFLQRFHSLFKETRR